MTLAQPAHAQAVTPEIVNTASNWTTKCDANGTCQIRAHRDANGALVSQVLIYTVGTEQVLEYLIPLGLDLMSGVQLAVDDQVIANTITLTCKEGGCIGYAPMTAQLLDALQRGQNLQLAFVGFDDNEAYLIAHDLNGFVDAYAAFSAGQQ